MSALHRLGPTVQGTRPNNSHWDVLLGKPLEGFCQTAGWELFLKKYFLNKQFLTITTVCLDLG